MAIVREAHGPVERLRPLAQAYGALSGGVFVGVVGEPPGVIVATAADAGLEAGPVLKTALEVHGGRGGGSARLAQGTVRAAETLEAVVAAVLAG